MLDNTPESISIKEASLWVAKMAAKDGLITNNERSLLKSFAQSFNIDPEHIYCLAETFCSKEEQEVLPANANEIKGRRFEEFVVSLLCDKTKFRLLAWRSDKIYQNIYAQENLYPDLHIKHQLGHATVEYFIECKYRSSWNNGVIDLSEQFLRCRNQAKSHNCELFIALGIGGSPSAPDEFLLIPARMIGYNKRIEQHRFLPCHLVPTPTNLHHYIKNYYSKRVLNHS